MKAKYLHAITVSAIFVFSFISVFNTVPQAHAAVSDWQKAASIFPHSPTDFDSDSFHQAVRNLQSTGANEVVLVIPIYQACDSCSDIFAGGDTPTDAALTSAINYVHSLGMKVVLKPHLGSQAGSGWRATIDASDRDAWFKNYGNYLNHLGDIGNQTGAEGLVMGTELISMADYTVHADNTARWNTMISNLRQHFHGFLTYSANWGWSLNSSNFVDEVGHVGFWSSLDYIGISSYYPLASNENNPPVSDLVASWQWWDQNELSQLASQNGKQIIFTEVGYTSISGAHNAPCCTWSGSYDGTEQANDYQALFQYWNGSSELAGVYLWNWDSDPNYGGAGNTDYTPWNKPAQQVLTTWFGGSGSSGGTGGNTGGTGGNTGGTGGNTGGNTGSSQVSGTFSVNATAPTLNVGQASTINATVNSSGSASNVVVDFEIYNSNGTQVLQKFFDGQTITSSQPGTYQINWTPPAEGTYTLKLGVFNANWTTNYYWNDGVIPLAIGQSDNGGAPSSGPLTTDIWWPSDGAMVSGVQPFKVLVENKSLSDYTEYWQVDGDQLNQMYDSQTDAPHKEALVDLTNWSWKGNGPYTITFVAKDSSGTTISSKSVNITVAH